MTTTAMTSVFSSPAKSSRISNIWDIVAIDFDGEEITFEVEASDESGALREAEIFLGDVAMYQIFAYSFK